MKTIAITGNIGSGKSTVLSILSKLGIPTISSDDIVHNLLSNDTDLIENIKSKFGNTVIDSSNRLIPSKIANIVFNDAIKRNWLEALIHPRVKDKIEKFAEENSKEIFLAAEIPLLFEIGWERDFDYIIIVECKRDKAIMRATQKKHLSKIDAESRINTQSDHSKRAADNIFKIDNNGGLDELRERCKSIIEGFLP